MASRKEYEMLFKLSAQLGAQFSGTFKNARSEITSMQNELQALKKTQGDISAYQKQQTALENSRRKLEVLQKEYANIQREMDETGSYSSALENRLLNKQLQIEKTSAAVSTYERKIDQMGEALRSAGVDTDNLADETKRLSAQYDDVKSRQQGVIDSLDEGGQRARFFGEETVSAVESIQQTLVAAGVAKLVKEIGEAMVECAKESIEFESAITGVYKTVDGSDQQLLAIKNDIKELATEIPATTEEISAVAEAAGQLGIATDNVMTFTGVMIDLGESTNLTAEEAASSLAKFSNITGTLASEYSRLGSVIVDLGNNYATTEADIVAMSTRLASAGTLVGLTEPEIMALATAMSSVGIEAEAGGTAMTQTLGAIEKAVANGGETLQEFARIAGMSAAEFSSTWEGSPITAIQAFIAGIGSLESKGESAVLVLDDLGLTGIRQSNMLQALGLAANTLEGAVDTANAAWDENIALTEEAGKRYATTESRLAMLDNSYSNLKVAIGDVYTPALRNAADVGMVILDGMTEFVEKNPTVVKLITALAVGVGAFSAALAGYIIVSKAASVATTALTAAMNANPFLLAATAVIGVVTAVATLAATASDDAVPSVKELTEAAREMNDVMDEAQATYNDTVTSTMAAANVADTYISKLEELESAGLDTNDEQEQYHNTLVLLCQLVPELASSIDLETDSIEGGTSALRANTEAWKQNAMQQAYQSQLTSLYESYSAVLIEAEQNSIGLTKAQYDLETAEKKQADAFARMDELWVQANSEAEAYYEEYGMWADATSFLTDEYYDLQNSIYELNDEIWVAQDTVKSYEKALEDDAEAVAAAEAEIASAEEAVESLMAATEENTAATAESAAQTEQIQTLLTGVNAEMATLAEAYTEAYEAAQESVSGQYALWDEAAEVVATSAGTINSALESQVTYWQNYNENLQTLTSRAGEIEGLSDVIASFADGSQESVNAIAGMASASDEDLAAMVANWQALQEEQANASGSIADLKTNFTSEMDQLQTELAVDIEAMDMGEEAAASGQATVQGFINAATSMLPQVQAAYARVAQTAADAINATLDIHSPSRVTEWSGEMAGAGFIQAAEKMEPQAAEAYANLGDTGATALAEEVQMVAMAPQLMAALMATRAAPAYAATPASGGGSPISLQVEYHINSPGGEDLTRQLDQSAQNLRDLVRQTVEDMIDDTNRRSYR